MKKVNMLIFTGYFLLFFVNINIRSMTLNNDFPIGFSPGQTKIKITGKVTYIQPEEKIKSTLTLTYKGKIVSGVIIKVNGYSLKDNGDGLYFGEQSETELKPGDTLYIRMLYDIRRDRETPPGELRIGEYKLKSLTGKSKKIFFKLSKHTAVGSSVQFIIRNSLGT